MTLPIRSKMPMAEPPSDHNGTRCRSPCPPQPSRTLESMNDWHRKLVQQFADGTPNGFGPDGATSLEIGFGQARSAIAYALELARAHRVPVSGNVAGDDVWMQMGMRMRFTLNRREGYVAIARPGSADARVRWDETKHALVDAAGEPTDLGASARDGIEALVADWRAHPSEAAPSSAPPPDFDDEPTKG